MKKFEKPEINVSMFDAESVTMLSSVGQANKAMQLIGTISETIQTVWKNWDIDV